MKYVQIHLEFHGCAISGLDDIFRLVHQMQRNGYAFRFHGERVLGDKELESVIVREEYIVSRRDEKTNLPVKWDVQVCGDPEGLEEADGMLRFDQFSPGKNQLGIGALLDFEFKDQRHLVEPYAQRLKDLGLAIYPLVGTTGLGYVEKSLVNQNMPRTDATVKLRTISWVNFIGPSFVEKYGRDFLMGLPGYRTEALPGGGVFHQLSPTFLTDDPKAARDLRQRVVAYCADHGLKVNCSAPYHVPGLSPGSTSAEEAVISDADLEVYLGQILATTLVLDDGTRVKPVHVPWDSLTVAQREIAIDQIRQVAMREIALGKAKVAVRFEFNELPEDLD